MGKLSAKQKNIIKLRENLETLLPKDKIDLLKQYFDAMANFYEIIPLKKAFEIIIEQNGESFSEDALLTFAKLVRAEEEKYYYSIADKNEFYDKLPECPFIEKDLVHESLLMFEEDYNKLSDAKEGKPYYVPPKDELLKYADEYYMPQSAHNDAMCDFIKKHVSSDPENISDTMLQILYSVKAGESSPLDAIHGMIQLRDIRHFVRHYDEFEALYTDWFNNMRNPYINGYTPAEYFELYNDRSGSMYIEGRDMTKEEIDLRLSEIVQKSEDFTGKIRKLYDDVSEPAEEEPVYQPAPKKVKVGRNDPCPCGSGKKYKKCCGA